MIIDVSLLDGDRGRSGRQDRARRRGRELRAAQRGARRLQPARAGRDVRGRRRRGLHAGRRLRAHGTPVRDHQRLRAGDHDDARRRQDRRGRRRARARPVVGGARRDRQPVRRPARHHLQARQAAVGVVVRAALDARGRAGGAGRDPAPVHARRRQRRRRLPGRDGDAGRQALPADDRAVFRRRRAWAARAAAAAGCRLAAVQQPVRDLQPAQRGVPGRASRAGSADHDGGQAQRLHRDAGRRGRLDEARAVLRDHAEPVQHHGTWSPTAGPRRPTRGRIRRSSTARSTATSASTRSGIRRGRTATRRPR